MSKQLCRMVDAYNQADPDFQWTDAEVIKFSEYIIKECMAVGVIFHGNGATSCVENIKNYFGITGE